MVRARRQRVEEKALDWAQGIRRRWRFPRLEWAKGVNEQRPCGFPFLWGRRGAASLLFDVKAFAQAQACCDRSTHDPHIAHSMRIMGKRSTREDYSSYHLPCMPAHCLGLAQRHFPLVCGPGPGLLSVY